MGSGSVINSANDDASFAKANHKQKLLDTGTAVKAVTPTGGGQDSYATDTSSGMIKGVDYESDPTGTLWTTKQSNILWNVKYGDLIPCSASPISNNFVGLWRASTTTGTISLPSLDTTNGQPLRYTSGSSPGNQTGQRLDFLYSVRDFNPSFKITWATDEAGANIRFFAGFTGSTAIVGNTDDPLNALRGFGIAMDTTQANYRIFHNNDTGATVSEDTGVAKDTGYHTFQAWADGNGNLFWWSLDGSTPVSVSGENPTGTQGIACQFTATAVNADAKVIDVLRCLINSDK